MDGANDIESIVNESLPIFTAFGNDIFEAGEGGGTLPVYPFFESTVSQKSPAQC